MFYKNYYEQNKQIQKKFKTKAINCLKHSAQYTLKKKLSNCD